MEQKGRVYLFEGGEVAVWWDGCVCIKTDNRNHDPVELSEDEGLELAKVLKYLTENGGNED
jgi:hypothetical protein